MFKILDKDGDGSLTPLEVKQGFEKHFDITITQEEIDEIMSAIDLNQNGLVEFSEFLILAQSGHQNAPTPKQENNKSEEGKSQMNYKSKSKLAFVFDAFDKDQDGNITAEDLMESLGILDTNRITKMMKDVGLEPDTKISYVDFCEMMKN